MEYQRLYVVEDRVTELERKVEALMALVKLLEKELEHGKEN